MFSNVVSLLWATLVFCLDGKAPVDARFVANEMRNHFIKCLKDTHLYLFRTLALNTKYQKYRVRFIRPFLKKATNVKEKQHSIPLLCYIILVIQRFIMSQSSRSSFRKNIPYKILAIGNCSDEIFGCSIEVLIPCETMTSRETSFQFQEIIGVSI